MSKLTKIYIKLMFQKIDLMLLAYWVDNIQGDPEKPSVYKMTYSWHYSKTIFPLPKFDLKRSFWIIKGSS